MKKRYIIIGVIIIVIVALRIYAPFFVKNQLNKQLNKLEDYHGHVEEVSLQIINGSAQIYDIVIYEETSTDPSTAFIDLKYLDVNIDWGQLFKGKLWGEIHMDSLDVNFVLPDEEIAEEAARLTLVERLEEIMPFRINTFLITNGRVSYIDPTIDPTLEIYFWDFFFEASNLGNLVEKEDTLPTPVKIESRIMDSGYITCNIRLNLMKDFPDFEFDIELADVSLVQFNDFTEAYADFSIHRGLMNLYTEAAAFEGYLTGYIKPVIENLEITPVEGHENGTFQRIYEGALDALAHLFENPQTGNIATRVDFQGNIDNPDVETWQAVWILIRNAFFESVNKGIMNIIEFEELTPDQ